MCFCRSTIFRNRTRIVHHYPSASTDSTLTIPCDSQSCLVKPLRFTLSVSFSALASSAPSSASPNDNNPVFLYYQPHCRIDRQETGQTGQTHFFALARLSRLSASCLASNFAFCCSRFSAAVIRGTISSNGFSTILIVLIFGGLSN